MRKRPSLTQKQLEKPQKARIVNLLSLSASSVNGILSLGNLRFPAALGRGGIRALKREGDGATPRGAWPAVSVYYRPDRVRRPVTMLPARRICPDFGWCDAPSDRNYNRIVRAPYRGSAEPLWRDDACYDIVVVLDYNLNRRSSGRGSAIFVHVARPAFTPTDGCIALKREHLLRLLAAIRRGTPIAVG